MPPRKIRWADRPNTDRKEKLNFKQRFINFFKSKKSKKAKKDISEGPEVSFAIDFYRRQGGARVLEDSDSEKEDASPKKEKRGGKSDADNSKTPKYILGPGGTYVYDASVGRKSIIPEGSPLARPKDDIDFQLPVEDDDEEGDNTGKKKAGQFSQQPSDRRRKSIAAHHQQHHHTKDRKVRGRPATRISMPWAIRILSNASTMVAIEALTCLLVYLYYLVVTYLYSFALIEIGLEVFLNFCDFYLVAEAIFRLGMEVWRWKADVDYTVLLLPCTMNMWILSLVALFPFDYFFSLGFTIFDADSINQTSSSELFRLNRIIYLIRVYLFIEVLKRERYTSDFTAFMLKFFLVYLGFIHFIACCYFLLVSVTAVDYLLERPGDSFVNQSSWLSLSYRTKPGIIPTPVSHYIQSLNFATSIVTTVGYGDPAPRNEQEMALGIFVMLLGAIIMAGLFGSTYTGFFLERDSTRSELFSRVNLIQKRLARWGSTKLFAEKVKEYYECMWNYREGVYRVDIIRQLPPSMYGDILFDICTEFFHKAVLFRGLEEAFLRAVSQIVEVAIYNPDMIVCHQGDRPSAMYYIIQGECVVKSKFSANVVTAILRPGCIFGESNLLLMYPHDENIETRTCCQFLIIRRSKLLEVFVDYKSSWLVMQSRLQKRIGMLLKNYELMGTYPITWTRLREGVLHDKTKGQVFDDYPVVLRWAHGSNALAEGDMGHGEAPVIVEMPCLDPNFANESINTYGNCVVTPTLDAPSGLLHIWHLGVLFLTLVLSLELAYATAIGGTSENAIIAIILAEDVNHPACFIFAFDLIIEILTSCPVTGVYYKFWDGIKVKKRELSFFVDIISLLPLIQRDQENELYTFLYVTVLHIGIGRVLKLFTKLARYFNYLDEKNPSKVFRLRLVKTLLLFGINAWLAACILFYLACDLPSQDAVERKCTGFNWLNSWYLRALVTDGDIKPEYEAEALANSKPFLLACHFSFATFSSAGFGDFGPHTVAEMSWIVFLQLYGFILVGYFTAKLTSALSCIYLPRVNFEERMVAVFDFCEFHGLSMKLRDRLRENYRLDHQYYEGVTLPSGVKYLMYDAPFFFSDDALYAEIGIHLEGVPIFSHADPERIISLAKLMHRYVLPPNIFFLHRGDVRRQLYIIFSGSVALLAENTDKARAILVESGHFGLRDLLYAEPAFNNVKTLSYCVIYALDHEDFSIVFGDDGDLMGVIENRAKDLQPTIDSLNKIFQLAGDDDSWHRKERKVMETPSWVIFPSKKNPQLKTTCTYEDFMEPFQGRGGRILRLLLMRRTIHPGGTFAVIWCLLSATAGLIIVLTQLFELMLQYLSPLLRIPNFICKTIFIVDVYLRLHWGFYTGSSQNYLVSHPYLTATHYLFEGPFIFTVMLEVAQFTFIPFILRAANIFGDGDGFKWASKLEMHRLVHLFRIPIFLQFGHSVVINRTFTLLLVYIVLTLVGCTVVACVAIYIACPWDQTRWMDDFPKKVPACFVNTWIDTKETLRDKAAYGAPRWLIATYYVCQTILVIGYGDMITLNDSELYLLLGMVTAGFVATRVIISDLTAAVISGDEIRGKYLERMKALEAVLRKQRVQRSVIRKVDQHLQYSWLLSKGLQPQEFLSDLHPALRADLYREYIGDVLSHVPLFYGLSGNLFKELCTHLRKFYFTRGERIMRRGSLEYEMYIIFDGDVWITGKNTKLMCTLGPGETFGESQMMFGMLRKYSAIAVNSVEVFALNSDGFAELLERYPYLQEHMETVMRGVRADLFERKIEFGHERFFLHEREQTDANDRVSEEVRRILAERDVQEEGELDEDEERVIDTRSTFAAFVERYIFAWGPLDAGLPLFYFASSTHNNRFTLLLHPRCGFQQYFSSLVVIVSILSPAVGMYQTVFPENNPIQDAFLVVVFTFTMEAIYVLHIILQFFTPFVTVEGKYCKEPARVRYRYLTFVSYFATDILSIIPFEIFQLFPALAPYTKYLKYLNLLKSLRLIHYYRSLNESLENITVTTFRYRVVTSVTTFCLLAHFLACIFYFVAPCDVNIPCREDTWTYEFVQTFLNGDSSDDNLKFWKWYIRSMYWVVTTVSTTGFGDIVATNLVEMSLSIICIFIGAFILAIILSQFTSGITSRDRHHREYLYQLKIVVRYLGSLGLSRFRQNALLEWFLMRWDLSRGLSFRKAVEILPLSMQINVTMALYSKTIHRVKLFKGMEPRFQRCLAYVLDHAIYLPGQVIASEGSKGNTLFIVARGRVSGYRLSRTGVPKLIRWYEDNAIFGRVPTFFYDEAYTKTYRAEVVTEILTLSKRNLFYLCRYFYVFERRVQEYIKDTYDPELGIETLFTMEKEARFSMFQLQEQYHVGDAVATLINVLKLNKKINTDSPYKKDKKKKKERKKKNLKKRPKPAVSEDKQALDEQFLESKAENLLKAFEEVEAQKKKEGLEMTTTETENASTQGWESVGGKGAGGENQQNRQAGGGEGPA